VMADGPAAPLECRERVNPIAATGAAMLRIITVGAATYVPPRPVYQLRQAVFGPEGGAEAAAAPLLSAPAVPAAEGAAAGTPR